MNNVENVDVASAGVFVGEAYEAGDMVGTWCKDLEKFFRVVKGTVLIISYIESILKMPTLNVRVSNVCDV